MEKLRLTNPDGTILSAEQVVVSLLQQAQQEIALNNEKYDELLKEYLKAQVELAKYNEVKKYFRLDKNAGENTGWHITMLNSREYYADTFIYLWEGASEEEKNEFKHFLDIFGLEMPPAKKLTPKVSKEKEGKDNERD